MTNLVAGTITNGHTQPTFAKQMNHYIRKHSFFEKSLATFTKSERRQFERNVYDFARGLGLKKSDARRHMIKAREFCGEEQYDSDTSTFEGEIDNSRFILETLSVSNSNESAAVSTAIDLPTRQVESSDETRVAPNVTADSAEDVASMSIALLEEACAQEPSKKIAAQKRERKRQKRLETIKDDRIEPGGNLENPDERANSQVPPQEPETKAGRKRKKKNPYPSLKPLMEQKALIEQQECQPNAEETSRKKKGRKRKRHGNDEMPVNAILSSGDDNRKSSERRKPNSRGTASDEASSPQPGQQMIEQLDF